MPTETWEIPIEYSVKAEPSYGSGVMVRDLAIFLRIAALVDPVKATSRVTEGCWVRLIGRPEEPRMNEVLGLLKEAGFSLWDRLVVPVALRHTHFAVLRQREYTKAEIEASKFLRLGAGYGCAEAGQHFEPGGTPWEHDPKWAVWIAPNRTKKVRLGVVSGIPFFIASHDFRKALETEGLANLDFEELRYILLPADEATLRMPPVEVQPSKVKTRLWALRSKELMPPCLLPRVTIDGAISDGTDRSERLWDDAGAVPPELAFKKSEVEGMGDFDIALTREWVGTRDVLYYPEIIISQKFRSVLRKHKIPGCTYTPVRLVD